MGFKFHDEYIIVVTLPTDSKQMEMGIHQENGSFATWEAADGKYQQERMRKKKPAPQKAPAPKKR